MKNRNEQNGLSQASSVPKQSERAEEKPPLHELHEYQAGMEQQNEELRNAQAALKESNERFRKIFEFAATGIAITDCNGHFIMCNSAYSQIIGYSEEELADMPYSSIIHQDYRDSDMMQIKRLLSGEIPSFEMENCYAHKTGATIWVHKHVSIISDDNGKPSNIIALITNVTEERLDREALINSRAAALNLMEDAEEARRKSEQISIELREQQEILKLFVNHAPAAVAMLDSNMRYLVCSNRWLLDHGLGQLDLVGRSHYEVFPEVDERWKAIYTRCMLGASERSDEDFFIRKDGAKEWLRWEIHPWMTGSGLIGGIIIFAEIITERKNAEEALRASESQYRRLFESAKDGILILDAETGMIDDVNPFLVRLLGYSREQFLGKKIWELGFFKDVIANQDNFLELQLKNYIRYEDLPLETADGRRIDVEFVSNLYFVEHRKVIQCNIRDITERKHIENSLKEKQTDLNRAQSIALIGSWRMDVQKKVLICSAEAHRIFDIPESTAMTYETILKMTHPDDLSYVGKKWKDALNGESYDIEHRIIVDGNIKWVREKAELEFDDNDMLLGGFGTIQDVTERKKREEELSRLNRTLKALSRSNQAMMRAANETEYMNEVCRIIVEDCGYKMVWIGFSEDEHSNTAGQIASAGFDETYLETFNDTPADAECEPSPVGNVIVTGETWFCKKLLANPKFKPWRKQALRRGCVSSAIMPLMDKSKAFGAVNIYSKESDSFSGNEINLLSELVDDLSHGIMELRLRKLHAETEEALSKSEKRYRTLFDSMTEGFALHEIICDADDKPCDYRFIEINQAFEKLTGLKRENVLHKTHNEVLPDDETIWLEYYGKVALTGEPVEFESYSATLKKYYQVAAYCPAPRQFAVVFMDISERKKVEEELRLSEKRQAVLSESASALLESVEPQKIIDEICRKTMELIDCQIFFNFLFVEEKNKLRLNAYWGIPEEEAKKIEWLDFGGSVCGCVARDGERIIAKDIFKIEDPRTELVQRYGIRAYCCHPLKTDEKVLGTISFGTTTRDSFTEDEIAMMKATSEMVTVAMQRKEWENKLVENEERLRLAQLSANVGVWELDLHTGVLFSTPELASLYGEPPLSLKNHHDFYRKVHPDDLARIEKERDTAIAGNRSFDLEFRINYSAGEVRWISAKGGAVYDKKGKVVRVFGVNSDITARKQAEEILKRDKETLKRIVKERSEKLLEVQVELERAKRLSDIGTLASTVAHELRNPLAAITISAAIIKRRSKNEAVEEQLKNIDKMVDESDQIINNLLFYSRLRLPHNENIVIYDIINECVENLSRQIKKNVKFKRNFDSLKDIMITADPIQLKEVFHNLLHNAADAVPDACGEVEVLASNYPEIIKIHIKDNGHGIDALYREKVFDPFFTTKAKGTGLGLTVCNQIVKIHGGSIDIESEHDKGTTITITLPKKGRSK